METVTKSPATTPAFGSDELPEVGEYRTVSPLSLISLLFGLAAPLCFISPLLMAIPLFGAALSIIALRGIAASEGALAGRWPAAMGLALCVASACAAVTHAQATRYLRSQQAEQFAREWIGLVVAGKTDQAFQRTVEGSQPPLPPEPGMPAPRETPRERFAHQPFVEYLAAAGPTADIGFDRTLSYEPRSSGQCFVRQRFTINSPEPPAAAREREDSPVEVIVTLQRSRLPGESAMRWLVAGYEAPGLPAADVHGDHDH